MTRYRKIDSRIWNDERFNALPSHSQLIYFYLFTHPNLTDVGAMTAEIPALASQCGMPMKFFKPAFDRCVREEWVIYDPATHLLWLLDFLKHNRPTSEDTPQRWQEALAVLPDCSLKRTVIIYMLILSRQLPVSIQAGLNELFNAILLDAEQNLSGTASEGGY